MNQSGSHSSIHAVATNAHPHSEEPTFDQLRKQHSLVGKRGLIFGVANHSSIAWGCAKVTTALGATNAIAYLNEKTKKFVEPLAREIHAQIFEPCDFTVQGELESMIDKVRKHWGTLDFVVFSCASAPKDEIKRPLLLASEEGMIEALRVSSFPLVHIARLVAPLMQEGGTIISMGYLGEETVVAGYDFMAPVKAHLKSTVMNLAAELGPLGIRVHDVSPGPIMTRASSGLPGFATLMEKAYANAPLNASVDIWDVGHLVAFLVSDGAKAMTAEAIHVDAGAHAVMVGSTSSETVSSGSSQIQSIAATERKIA